MRWKWHKRCLFLFSPNWYFIHHGLIIIVLNLNTCSAHRVQGEAGVQEQGCVLCECWRCKCDSGLGSADQDCRWWAAALSWDWQPDPCQQQSGYARLSHCPPIYFCEFTLWAFTNCARNKKNKIVYSTKSELLFMIKFM